ncbi:MAG: hypothetical protein ACQXXD_04430 [Thermoplasmatota archaeon]|jgi:hypothetical protein
MKKLFVLKITALAVSSILFVGMLAYTNVYTDIQTSIVETLCLSCIKLRSKTSRNFTFETANGKPHPDFVLENLTKGPVFLHYSERACPACDVMYPVIKQFFNVEFQKEKSYFTLTSFENSTVVYIYIYLDDSSTPKEWLDSFRIYDNEHIKGLPMFTIITLEYEHGGEIKPYYTTLSGTFLDTNEERIDLLTKLMQESFELYNKNRAGYPDYN